MRARCSLGKSALSLCLLSFITISQAHTWVEQMSVIASNGTFIGAPGFARGNVLRTSPGFNDGTMTNLIPPNGRSTGNAILATDPMCKSTQTVGTQTPGSPALSASPGDMVALRYQENGHVTLPQNQPGKPANRGTIYIYGTSKASNDDKFLSIHNVWNEAGTGGDGRGVLLATRNFDDGQCYQVNGGTISQTRQKQFAHTADQLMGANLWCQSDVTLPKNLGTSGSYTLYWVWDWPTEPSASQPAGLNETYTTCMDISLSSGSGTSNGLKFAQGQDLNSAAIASELSTSIIVQPTASGAVASAPVTSVAAASPATAPSVPVNPPAAAPSPSATGNPAGGSFRTVTVTEQVSGVTVTVTETVGGVFASQPASISPQATVRPAKATTASGTTGSTGSGTALNIQPFFTNSAKALSIPPASSPSPSPQPTALDVLTVGTTVVVTDIITSTASLPRIRGRAPKSEASYH